MHVNELRTKREELELNISANVSKLVEDFKAKTGFCPKNISIGMIDNTRFGDKESSFVVGKTDCDLGI